MDFHYLMCKTLCVPLAFHWKLSEYCFHLAPVYLASGCNQDRSLVRLWVCQLVETVHSHIPVTTSLLFSAFHSHLFAFNGCGFSCFMRTKPATLISAFLWSKFESGLIVYLSRDLPTISLCFVIIDPTNSIVVPTWYRRPDYCLITSFTVMCIHLLHLNFFVTYFVCRYVYMDFEAQKHWSKKSLIGWCLGARYSSQFSRSFFVIFLWN